MRSYFPQRNARRLTRLSGLVVFLCLLAAGTATAEPAINLFGPKTFQKGAGSSDVFNEDFTAPPEISELRVVVKNGPGGERGVKSARVVVNDSVAFETADLHSSKARPSKNRVGALPQNQLQVILRGGGEGTISVQVLGILPVEDSGKKLKK